LLASFVFLTPRAGLVMLACAIPLVGLALAARRVSRARDVLGLEAPPPVSHVGHAVALAAIPLLLGLAAMQPALRSTKSAHVRTDAEAFFVVDVSRSMLASRSTSSATRFARAKQEALELRDAIPEVPAGIATLTDRVVPNLLPNADRNVFAQTITRALKIQQPPAVSSNPQATSLGALGALGTQNFFGRGARKRVLVVLTDGESVAFDPAKVAKDLGAGPGVKVVVVQMGDSNEQVFETDGKPETAYHAHPESSALVESLVTAVDGRSFDEASAGGAARAIRAAAGNGPTVVQGRTERTRTLAPYIALLALVPLLFVLPRVGRGLGTALRVFASGETEQALAWLRKRSKPRAQVPERGLS
jgi:hypothetical protein